MKQSNGMEKGDSLTVSIWSGSFSSSLKSVNTTHIQFTRSWNSYSYSYRNLLSEVLCICLLQMINHRCGKIKWFFFAFKMNSLLLHIFIYARAGALSAHHLYSLGVLLFICTYFKNERNLNSLPVYKMVLPLKVKNYLFFIHNYRAIKAAVIFRFEMMTTYWLLLKCFILCRLLFCARDVENHIPWCFKRVSCCFRFKSQQSSFSKVA